MHDQDPRIGWLMPVITSVLVHEFVMEFRIVREIVFRMARPGSVRDESDLNGGEKVLVVCLFFLFLTRIRCHWRAPSQLSGDADKLRFMFGLLRPSAQRRVLETLQPGFGHL